MLSFSCQVLEKSFLPDRAVLAVKKAKTFSEKYDRGFINSATSKIDDLTRDWVAPAQKKMDWAKTTRDQTFDFIDAHLEPVEGEVQSETMTGKVLYLPVNMFFRAKSKGVNFATSKFDCVKSQATEIGTPYFTQLTETTTKMVELAKGKFAEFSKMDAVQSTLTHATSAVGTVKSEYVLPFYSYCQNKISEFSASESFKEVQTHFLDAKSRVVTSAFYTQIQDGANYAKEFWPVSVAVEYSNLAWKTGLSYVNFWCRSSSAAGAA